MSHTTTVYSVAGTPLEERTVGELVAENPNRSRVFQKHRIDFCCSGNRSLRESCEKAGVSLAEVTRQLAVEDGKGKASEENPAELGMSELCEYIMDTHHEFLKEELPRLLAMAKRVAQVHGGGESHLVELSEVVQRLTFELAEHLNKEEGFLFPAIRQLDEGGEDAEAISLEGPVGEMLREHEDAGQALVRIRELTSDFEYPDHACNTYRALFTGLKALEEDIQRHVHLENSVLFPRALGRIGNVQRS